jgi:hypothetical protein
MIAVAGLDRVEERRFELPEFSNAIRAMGVRSRAGRQMTDAQVSRAFLDVCREGRREPRVGGGGGQQQQQQQYASFEEACCWMTRMACGGAIVSQRQGGA